MKNILLIITITLIVLLPNLLCSQHEMILNPINNSHTIVLDGTFTFFSPSSMSYSWDYVQQGGEDIKAHRFLGVGSDGIYSFEYSLLSDKRYTVDYEEIGQKYIANLAAEFKSTYRVISKEVKYLDKCDMTGYDLFFEFGGGEIFGNMFTGVRNDIRYLMVIIHRSGASSKTTNLYYNLLTVK